MPMRIVDKPNKKSGHTFGVRIWKSETKHVT